MHISQLQPPQQIICWSKLGLAIQPKFNLAKKKPFYQAPSKPGMARSGDLVKFGALVLSNDPVNKVLHLSAYPLIDGFDLPNSQRPLDTSLHYSYFRRVRLLSPISFTGRPNDPKRPTDYTKLSQTSYRPYRTLIEVQLW